MQSPEQITRHPWTRGTLRAFLIVALPAALAVALPTGHREDFNGCSSQEDQASRKTCCDEVARDCTAVCDDLHSDAKIGPGGWIVCGMDCDEAKDTCTSGSTIAERVDWPGQPALQIPGVLVDDSRMVAEPGVRLGVSTRSMAIEIRGEDAGSASSACREVVTRCSCSLEGLDYEAAGQEYRPVVTPGAVECRICPIGADSRACQPGHGCTPTILSVRPCAPATPAPRKASGS